MKSRETPVLIVGAGPAGAAAALALAKAGQECLLVDKAQFPRDKVCGDALSGKVTEVLRKLDPAYLEEFRQSAIQLDSWGVHFIAPNRKGIRIPFKPDFDKSKDAAPGFISKRLDFDNFLVEKVREQSKISLLENVFLTEFAYDGSGILATDKNQTVRIHSKLLIAADGPYSASAQALSSNDLDLKSKAYGIRAYYEEVEGMDKDNFIELHFLRQLLPGYFWIFPLPEGRANVGIGVRADVLKKKKINLKKQLESLLEEDPILRKRFRNARLHGKPSLFPLPFDYGQRRLSGDHFLLTGDAAGLIDPFTGEGIGNAMFSGYHAAELALEAIKQENYTAGFLQAYDQKLNRRFAAELQLSRRLQQLVNYPRLFNFVVQKAEKNPLLRDTISCMFDDLDIRAQLRRPSFYFKLLLNKRK